MFKLTYQAFVLSYLTAGYITMRVVQSIKLKHLKIIVLLLFGTLYSSILQYPKFAIDSYYNELENYRGIRGDTWINTRYPGEKDTIDWFNTMVSGQPVILEASGDSYTDFNLISAYTGLPTINGWFVHEWLWRGDASIPQQRVSDITTIYTSTNTDTVLSLLKKYNVTYIIVGTFERQKYTNIHTAIFERQGDLVYQSGSTKVYQINYDSELSGI